MLNSIKKQYMMQLVALVLLIGICFFVAMENYVDQPVLSVKGGFYEEPFELVISAMNADGIYYTLDGSVPDETSIRYTGPIQITDATNNENVYSMREDLSAGMLYDVLEKHGISGAGYAPPDYLIDKCTIIRAVAIHNGIVSDEITATYFVGIPPERYQGANVISIITDPDNLFDSEIGIYVTGNKLEEYLAAGKLHQYWNWWSANYTQRGAEWEREATFQIFNSNGELVLSKLGGIRNHGGFTRAALPRSLNLYARQEYDGQDSFNLNLFGNDYDPQRVCLTSGGNQAINQFPDYMMTQMTRELNFSTMLFEPYVMFLDGEYWGFYWLSEKFDEVYLSHYYDVAENQVVMIKNGAVEAGAEEDIQLYQQMMQYFETTDMSVEDNYATACEMIDIDSFIDYYATMIYIGRTSDWPNANFALWRTRTGNGDGYGDGKWRWMLFDCNSRCMRADVGLTRHDTLTYVREQDVMFRALWNNTDFQDAFKGRIMYIADACFDAEKMDSYIQEYTVAMKPILAMSWERFFGDANMIEEQYYTMMESYRQFFLGRRTVVESWFS